MTRSPAVAAEICPECNEETYLRERTCRTILGVRGFPVVASDIDYLCTNCGHNTYLSAEDEYKAYLEDQE